MEEHAKSNTTAKAHVQDTLSSIPAHMRHQSRTEPQPDTLVTTLQFERTHILYSELPTAIVISALLALILAYAQWEVISSNRILGWLAALYSVLLGRTVLFSAWKKLSNSSAQLNTRRWLWHFRIGTMLAAIVWGSGGVLLAPSSDIGHFVYVSFALAGLCAGGATTLAIDSISVNFFTLVVLTPQIIFLASESTTIAHGMSVMMTMFMFFLMASAWQLRFRLEEDIHLRYKATESELRLRKILEGSPIAARIVDASSNKVVFANKSYLSLIESTPEQVIGLPPSNYYAHPDEYVETMKQVRLGINVVNKLVELQSPKEKTWTKWVLASYFTVEYQNKPAVLAWFYDITDRKLVEEKVEHLAYHDTLTGLPNRYLFRDRLEQAIATAQRGQSALALLFVDLDRFKLVNDWHGHNIGDLLLMAIAQRILGCLRKTDSAARVGGDEFVVLLPSLKSEDNAVKIAEHIRREISKPFNIEGVNLNISASTGIAFYPYHAGDGEQLIKQADTAMYFAKADGRNRVKTYYPGLEEHE